MSNCLTADCPQVSPASPDGAQSLQSTGVCSHRGCAKRGSWPTWNRTPLPARSASCGLAAVTNGVAPDGSRGGRRRPSPARTGATVARCGTTDDMPPVDNPARASSTLRTRASQHPSTVSRNPRRSPRGGPASFPRRLLDCSGTAHRSPRCGGRGLNGGSGQAWQPFRQASR